VIFDKRLIVRLICFPAWCLLMLISLIGCAAPQSVAPSSQPAADQTEDSSENILVPPTIAPTATPDMIGKAVEQVLNSEGDGGQSFLGLTAEDWVNLGFSLLVVLISFILVAGVINFALKKLARRTPTPYDDIFIKSIRPYIRWLIGIIALDFATIRLQFLKPAFKHFLSQFFFTLTVAIVVLGIWKLIDIYILFYREKAEKQGGRAGKEAVLLLAERALRFVLILIGLTIVLDRLGVNINALVTALGIGGLALSLAAQDTIANMISGIIILLDAPFRVGDRIEIQGLDTWGDVVDIGLRTTRIRTLDNRMVIVPNSNISKNQVVNYTFPDPRYRTQTEIGVAYGSDLRQVREVITESLRDIQGVIQDKPVDILFLEFGDSAINLRVRWWIESYEDARRITDRVNEAMLKALEQAQIELPAPIMTVELKENKPQA